MEKNITIFSNSQFGEIRTVLNEVGEPMFCLVDVCKALGLTNPTMVKQTLWGDGLSSTEVIDSLNRVQSATFITEANVYKCIFQSRKEEAQLFQRWICREVIPTIRKHGAYMTPAKIEEALLNPDVLIQLATTLKEERQKRLAAEATITENAPRVIFAQAVEGSVTACLIGELAKIITQNGYEIGEKRLFAWLRNNGYLGTKGERYNIPNQKYIEQGLFTVKKGVRSGNGGVLHTTITPKVTGKGQIYFINKFLTELKHD